MQQDSPRQRSRWHGLRTEGVAAALVRAVDGLLAIAAGSNMQ
ncbi:MAG: hypothetical protein SVX43_14340 [Cyanobacteriota bacterium]|nr:hypothetical protein [Cyanobacteriota bacterium]